MEFRSYNAELAIANLMFKNIFSNIIIDRQDSKGNKKQIVVNCQLGQRSRIFKSWQNAEKMATVKFPMIIINRTGYSRQPERLNNLHNEVKHELTSKLRKYELLAPIPIDISYDVSIVAKYQSDIDQIATNFMIFFNSDIYVSCNHPKYDGITMNNQVIMSDSISEEHPDELDSAADDFITNTFQFTFKTYLFGGTTQAKPIQPTIISSYTQTVLSNVVLELQPNEIAAYMKRNPTACLSTMIKREVETTLTSEVLNPELSNTTIYEGIVPIIHELYTHWYPVPDSISDYNAYTTSVDNYSEPERFRDTLIWKINPTLSVDFPNNVVQV